VKQFQIRHTLLKHNQYICEINVKPWSITRTVQGSDGSFLKHLPIYPCIIEPLPFKLKQMRNMLAELIQSNQWSSSETFNGVHVKFVKQFQIAHALLEHK
jgi:hypothetical protein